MKSFYFILFPALLVPGLHVRAQQVDDMIKKGNDLYKQQQYEPAKTAYDEALAKDSTNTIAKFNQANTAYRLSKPDDAIRSFDYLSGKYENANDKAKAYYNKGVVLTNQKRLEESIEEYKNALRQNPNDKEARENLQKALMELKKKTPPPKKEDKKKQQNKKQKEQPKMNQKEAEQKLKLLEQKEKELQQRLQQQKSKTGGSSTKDW